MTILGDELCTLRRMVLEMGTLVERAIDDAVGALIESDIGLARSVIENDCAINAIDVAIDEECIRLIALQQPVAGDLRFIVTAMKLITDLERIGDLAAHVAQRVIELGSEDPIKPYITIPQMAELVRGMTGDVLQSLLARDAGLARSVIARDARVDALMASVSKELNGFMTGNPTAVSAATKLSFIAKNLERIGDHATNMAEMVVYLVEGRIIRHTSPRGREDA